MLTDTKDPGYAARLRRLAGSGVRRFIDVQAPYRWNLRRLDPGFVLDIGCGIGRNLTHLDGRGVGVDHNVQCIEACREKGFTAYTADTFHGSADAQPARYDTLLFSHVVEHMDAGTAEQLLREYLPYLKRGGRVILVTPQEKGYDTDSTHVRFVGFAELDALCEKVGLVVTTRMSFPFPRLLGSLFTYNEFVAVAVRP